MANNYLDFEAGDKRRNGFDLPYIPRSKTEKDIDHRQAKIKKGRPYNRGSVREVYKGIEIWNAGESLHSPENPAHMVIGVISGQYNGVIPQHIMIVCHSHGKTCDSQRGKI